jgi:hypothetical protein
VHANELDPKGIELGQGVDQVPRGSGESVKAIDNDGIELASFGVGHEPVKLRAAVFGAADTAIDVLINNGPVARSTEIFEFADLHTDILAAVERGNASV